jgi:hypothetical protein
MERLLPSAFCLLPSAFRLLPSAFCLLISCQVLASGCHALSQQRGQAPPRQIPMHIGTPEPVPYFCLLPSAF